MNPPIFVRWAMKVELTRRDKILVALWLCTWFAAIAMAIAGCEGEPMTDLTDEILPQQLGTSGILIPPANAAARGVAGQGPLTPMLQFKGNDWDPRVVTVALNAFDKNNTAISFGPLVAIVQWGSGNSGSLTAELDIPGNNYSPADFASKGFVEQGGGIVFSVPCSSVQVKARNDGRYIPPLGNLTIGSNSLSAFGQASMGVGSGPSSPLYRTIWQVAADIPGQGLAAAATTTIVVPPYARTARVIRSGTTGAAFVGPSMLISPINGAATADTFAVAQNVLCPEFPIFGNTTFIQVKNTDVNEIFSLAVVYSIGLN